METELKRSQDNEGRGYHRVFSFIRDQLVSGQLRSGDRLASERELAARLGVSRPVLREVLRALAAMGVIEIRHGYGSIVRKPNFAELSDLFTMMLAQQSEMVEDIMEARIAIERQAILLACKRATQTDIDALREVLLEIEQTVRDPVKGADADFRFHRLLVAAAHSSTLASLHVAIDTLLRRSHLERRRRISHLPNIDQYLVNHHRQLLAAIVQGDDVQADRLLIGHFAIGTDLQRQSAIREITG